MEVAQDPQNPRTARTWIPCAISTLLLFGLSTLLRSWVGGLRKAMELPVAYRPPAIPAAFLNVGFFLWIAILLGSAWGLRLILTSRRSVVLNWYLWMTTALAAVHVFEIYALCELNIK